MIYCKCHCVMIQMYGDLNFSYLLCRTSRVTCGLENKGKRTPVVHSLKMIIILHIIILHINYIVPCS